MQIQKPRQGYKLVKLGYSQLAEIPIDWEVTKINTISKIVSGTGFPLQYQKGDIGEILFIKVSDMNLPENILYIKKTNNSVSKETAKSINARLCPANTIIFPKIGATIYTHKRAMLSKESCFDNNVMGLIPQKIEPFFLFYLLSQIRLENFSQTTALPYLDDSIVGNIKIPTCELVEEQKIASILSNVDSLIQQTQKEIEQTQRLKKGLMQRLLTKGIGHNRFKKVKWLFEKNIEIPEYWKRATVSEIFQLRTGGTPSRSRPEYFSGDIPWVTSTDLNRGTITQTLEKITVEAKEKTRLKIFPKGTFVIATYGLEAAGTRGKCGILAFNATIN
ncbi:MAG: restriction endonuclease subunit S, partial [Nitrosopumilaceae archaeon]